MRRAMLGLSPTTVILPESLAQPTQSLLDAYGALDGTTLPCSIVPLAPGNALPHKEVPILTLAHQQHMGNSPWGCQLSCDADAHPLLEHSCNKLTIADSGNDLHLLQDRSTSCQTTTL